MKTLNETMFFSLEESAQLHSVGVKADAAWKVKREFRLGQGYVTLPPKLVRLDQVPPINQRYRNVYYFPAMLKPEV